MLHFYVSDDDVCWRLIRQTRRLEILRRIVPVTKVETGVEMTEGGDGVIGGDSMLVIPAHQKRTHALAQLHSLSVGVRLALGGILGAKHHSSK